MYGGSCQENMSPENMHSFAEVLKAKNDPQELKILLKIMKRLVSWHLTFFKVCMFLLCNLLIFLAFFLPH